MDAVVMAAAVADFRPAQIALSKIKKAAGDDSATLELVVNPDILAGLSAHRPDPAQLIVGFAAETGDERGSILDHGRAKLARKGCDLLVVNGVDAGRGFEVDENSAVILAADGATPLEVPLGPKTVLAAVICDELSRRLAARDEV